MSGAAPQPPRRIARLLACALPDDVRDAMLGDLEESFHARLAAGDSVAAVRRWYCGEALHAIAAFALAPRARRRSSSAVRGDSVLATVASDARYALRSLALRPGFLALAVLTIAVGIGASTAIFTTVNAILFRSLPYPRPERLVVVWERGADGLESNTGFATFSDLAERSRSFASMAAFASWLPTMTGRGEAQRLTGQRVSWTYFRALGVHVALGRDFERTDDDRGHEPTVILSQALWRTRFGGDSSVIGRAVALDGEPFTIVGVMPAGFENVLEPAAQLWRPLRYDRSLPWACRTCRHLRVVARLAPGVSMRRASSELDALSAALVRAYPTEYPRAGMHVVPLHEQVTREVRPALLAVLGAVALVLLVACVNVSSLLLSRGAQRRTEFTVRVALGAGRGRLTRQLLTESLVLAAIGGTLGVLLATWGVHALAALAPAAVPRLEDARVDGGILLFALALTTAAGVLFGLVPAFHAVRDGLEPALRRGSRGIAGARVGPRAALVVTEIALALVLLVGAGLLLQSVRRLLAVSPGFDAARVLTMEVQTSGPRYKDAAAVRAFFASVLDSVRRVPGVESAAFVSQLPLTDDFDKYGVHFASRPSANPEQDPSAHRYAVTGDYVGTMRIPLLRGRALGEEDRADAPPVALVNASFARRVLGSADAIGQRVRVGSATDGPWRTIIGVVGDVRQVSLADAPPDAIYLPEAQWPYEDDAMSLVVRTHGEPAALAPRVRRAIRSVDADQPIVRVAAMPELLASSAAQRRFALQLFEAFAAIALLLAAAGIYGVLSGMVVERMRELGIRSALGATRRDILLLVLRRGLGVAAAGVVVGLAGALALSRVIEGLLFSISPVDPATYAMVALLLLVVALLACLFPALRAARVDPARTLRAE